MKALSIVIPVFNERETLLKVLEAVQKSESLGFKKEIILVDDFSNDGTREILEKLKIKNQGLKIFYNERNYGKGYSIRKGIGEATGDFLIIQDADLEYDPKEYSTLLAPLVSGKVEVVYGSRFKNIKFQFKSYFLANKFLTLFSNLLSGLHLTDMETCYKCFTQKAFLSVRPRLRSNRFDIEPEITAHIAKLKLSIGEVPISYYRRSYAEGKKIGFSDGLQAIWAMIKYNLL